MGNEKTTAKDSRTVEAGVLFTDQIKHLRNSAAHAEESHDWQKAVEFYDQALASVEGYPQRSLIDEFELHESVLIASTTWGM